MRESGLIEFHAWLLVTCLAISGEAEQTPDFPFKDVLKESGLHEHIYGIQAHAAAWGDVDGDGALDLFFGAFYRDLRDDKTYQAPREPVPGRVYVSRGGKFIHDPECGVEIKTDCTGAVFADFDNDGDLDLYISNYRPKEEKTNSFFENNGKGHFKNISEDSGACPEDFRSRGLGLMDFDADGLLDLFVVEGDRPTRHSKLFRNLGGLRFENVTEKAGLPGDINGLGIAVGDVTGNGWPDFYVGGFDANRLFLNDKGRYREAVTLKQLFHWQSKNPTWQDDKSCGATFGDVNRDGRLDLLVGHHYKMPWRYPEPFRLYLNDGMKGGEPVFRNVTKEVGLEPLTSKAPHVEIQDFDNDGWPDLYTTIIVRSGESLHPVIYKNLGIRDGLPRFRERASGRAEYPTEEHQRMTVHELVNNSPVRYFGVGPSCDYDGDGRLDLMLPAWWPRLPSLLLKNMTPNSNHWLRVKVVGEKSLNRMGIGARVSVFPAGRLGEASSLISCQEIATGYGYASSHDAVAHIGLGTLESCDIAIELPGSESKMYRKNVQVDQTLLIKEEI
ncbi:MAG: CRTAC1 family protein [Planctomycetota bacterium]|nr:CRTAC1 family protein [Planctomycetota bacterium]